MYRTCVENLRSCAYFDGGGLFRGARAPWNGFATYDPDLDQRLQSTGGSGYDVREFETSLLIVTATTLALPGVVWALSTIRSRRRTNT